MKQRNGYKGITLIALVITIVVLIILAGITITSLTGEKSIIKEARTSKELAEKAALEEQVEAAIITAEQKHRNPTIDDVIEEIKNNKVISKNEQVNKENGDITSDLGYLITGKLDDYIGKVSTGDGNTTGGGDTPTPPDPALPAPEAWETTNKADSEWYNYGNSPISGPKLVGKMTPIKYVGQEQTGNKWANAITADGSMWVWIPRYAYKITEGHHSSTAGKIEVAFVKANGASDNFLNGETGEITRNPSEEGAGTTKWLVHPAFTANATNGGGFGEIDGLWVGKFEATGTETNLSVKPGVASLRSMTINNQYKLAKASQFGETATINSHMAKNSEWGAIVYLAHSQYGTNGLKVEQNTNSSYYTGGSSSKATIYTTNKTQSTTHNATGVYDLNGGAWEYVASYVNNGSSYLKTNGGEAKGDLYGAEDERATSTAYKMVYEGVGSQSTDYETAKKYKGDAVYETSNSYSNSTGSWFAAYAYFPYTSSPFFYRGGYYSISGAGTFYFAGSYGSAYSNSSFRSVLAF